MIIKRGLRIFRKYCKKFKTRKTKEKSKERF